MKWRMTIPRWELLALLVLAALVALFPMRVAMDLIGLDRAGFTAREVRGSVWNASLSEAQFGGAALGDVDASLSPLPLLLGRAQVNLSNATGLNGRVTIARRSVEADIDQALLEGFPALGAVSIGALRLSGVAVKFVDGQCVEAGGNVSALVTLPWAEGAIPPLDARIRCDAGALLLPLASAGGAERLEIRLHGDRRVQARAVVSRLPAMLVPLLGAAGFRVAGDTLAIEREWVLGE